MTTTQQQAQVETLKAEFPMINFSDLSCLYENDLYVVKVEKGWSEVAKDINVYIVENKLTGVKEAEVSNLARAIYMTNDFYDGLKSVVHPDLDIDSPPAGYTLAS